MVLLIGLNSNTNKNTEYGRNRNTNTTYKYKYDQSKTKIFLQTHTWWPVSFLTNGLANWGEQEKELKKFLVIRNICFCSFPLLKCLFSISKKCFFQKLKGWFRFDPQNYTLYDKYKKGHSNILRAVYILDKCISLHWQTGFLRFFGIYF